MVLKTGKCGVRSGNTLRASNSRSNRQYQAESCIVRKSAHLSRRHDPCEADDSLISADGVVYSLNKKGRWVLPQMIKENIKHEHHEVRVAMYERHKLKRQSNCVEFNCNKGKLKSVVSSNGYFNDSSLQSEQKTGRKNRSRRRRRRNDRQEEENPDAEPPAPEPEVRYDVFYPSSATSSISHNPKYTKSTNLIVYGDGLIREAGPAQKQKGRRHRVKINCWESNSDYDENDSLDEEENEEENVCDDEDVSDHQSPELLLVDIFSAAQRAKDLCSDSEHPKRRTKTKKKRPESSEHDWVVVPETESEDEAYSSNEDSVSSSSNTLVSSVQPTSSVLEPTRVILQCVDLEPSVLRDKFGQNYMEAQCLPRKFTIDTTENVKSVMRSSKIKNMTYLSGLDLSSCLVFSHNASYDKGLDVYNVYLNINTNMKKIQIETIFDLMNTSVEELIQAAASYSSMLPPDTFQKRETSTEASSLHPALSFDLLSSVDKWNAQSVTVNKLQSEAREDFDIISGNEIAEAAAAAASLPDDKSRRPDFCDICFQDINSELLQSETATCMKLCGHWFCDGCWREHIAERIYSGSVKITCPEYKCNTVIDTVTMLSLVSIKLVHQFEQLRVSLDVDCSPCMKWCPRPRCGRVLKADDSNSNPINITCPCGMVACYKCMKEAHWPASCEQRTRYTQQLNKNGDGEAPADDSKAPAMIVHGKFCPHCNRHIEKNGGCKYMQCMCRHQFCWACLKPWDSKYHGNCQLKSDEYKTVRTVVRHVDTSFKDKTSRLYKMALVNRSSRHQQKLRAQRATVNALSLQLREMMGKGVDIGTRHLQPRNETSPVQKEQVHDFLVQMMQLKLELHHVIEHTAVLLDGRQSQPGSKKMLHIAEKLEQICISIDIELESRGRSELSRVLSSLTYLRTLARRGLVAMVTLLSQIQAVSVEEEDDVY